MCSNSVWGSKKQSPNRILLVDYDSWMEYFLRHETYSIPHGLVLRDGTKKAHAKGSSAPDGCDAILRKQIFTGREWNWRRGIYCSLASCLRPTISSTPFLSFIVNSKRAEEIQNQHKGSEKSLQHDKGQKDCKAAKGEAPALTGATNLKPHQSRI